MKKAVITGCFGQDGQLLYELLSKKGYKLVGIGRNSTLSNSKEYQKKQVSIIQLKEVESLVKNFKPDEIYHLAAFHESSQEAPSQNNLNIFKKSYAINVSSLVHFLESVRKFSPRTKIFYAGSSHVFGRPKARIQDENTPFNPENIYGITKTAGILTCRYYRNKYSVFAACGILYNHESHLRDPKFVTRKIIQSAIAIKKGRLNRLHLGNLKSQVDWGYAPDYVEAMHRILQLRIADDFVIASGKKHSVLEFVQTAFGDLGLDWKSFVKINPGIIKRKSHVLVGSPRKLMKATGWKPSVDFKTMIRRLLEKEGAQVHER